MSRSPKRPDRLWGSLSLLFSGYRRLRTRGKSVGDVKLKNARSHIFTLKYTRTFTRTVLLLALPLPAYRWKHSKETKCRFSGYSCYNRNLITSNEAVLRDCRSNISTPGTACPAASVISAGISDTVYKCRAVIKYLGPLDDSAVLSSYVSFPSDTFTVILYIQPQSCWKDKDSHNDSIPIIVFVTSRCATRYED